MPVVPPLNTNTYPQYEELSRYLHNLEEAVPHLVKVYAIGTSPGGRALLVAEVTNRGTGEAVNKPSIWIDGNSEGSDTAGSVACLAILQRLATDHGRDEIITDILDRCAFYIMPRVCADEAEECLTNGCSEHEICAGMIARDLDGDGRIVQMRKEHPLGEWKISAIDNRLMVPRLPDDNDGIFYHLYREGVCAEMGQNQAKISTRRSEMQARADFLRNMNNISIVLSLGADGEGIVISDMAAKEGTDAELWRLVGQRLANIAEVPLSEHQEPHDEWLDTLYREQGQLALSAQLWNFPLLAGIDSEEAFTEIGQQKLLRWLDSEFAGAGFVPWTEYQHPQLGKVEIGGWDLMQTWYNPPTGDLLEAFCNVHVSLALGLIDLLPCLTWSAFSDVTVGWAENDDTNSDDLVSLRRIDLELGNSGYLPTWFTTRGKKTCAPLTVRVELPEGGSIVSGESVYQLPQLAGSACAHLGPKANSVFCMAPAEKRSVKVSWIVRGEGCVSVVAEQARVGQVVFASQSTKKTVKTAPAYQSATEAHKSAETKPAATPLAAKHPTYASAESESVASMPAAPPTSVPPSTPPPPPRMMRPTSNHARAERNANSTVNQARNVSLLQGMSKPAEPALASAPAASEPVPVNLLGGSTNKSVVRPVSLINKAGTSANTEAPAPEPKVPSATPRPAMGGYRPTMRPAPRSSSDNQPASDEQRAVGFNQSGEYRPYASGEYRPIPEREAVAPRPLIRNDSPLRKEQPAVTGRVFGQSAPKTSAAGMPAATMQSAPPPPVRATFGRPVGQSDAERRQVEIERSAVENKYEGHEVKPHSLLAPKTKSVSVDEKPAPASASPTPTAPPFVPSEPVTAQLLRNS